MRTDWEPGVHKDKFQPGRTSEETQNLAQNLKEIDRAQLQWSTKILETQFVKREHKAYTDPNHKDMGR